jgi:hypothetical protein
MFFQMFLWDKWLLKYCYLWCWTLVIRKIFAWKLCFDTFLITKIKPSKLFSSLYQVWIVSSKAFSNKNFNFILISFENKILISSLLTFVIILNLFSYHSNWIFSFSIIMTWISHCYRFFACKRSAKVE